MALLQFISVSFIIIWSQTVKGMEKELITDYFKMKNIHQIIVFHCDEKNIEQINAFDYLMANNMYATSVNLNVIDFEILKTFHSDFGRVGFTINGDCANTNLTLKSCGEEILFGDKYPWLIFSRTNDTIFQILSQVYLNVNAEISVAIENETNWILYDVYNPGYKHGGSLKSTFMGTWSVGVGFIISRIMFYAKYLRRKDLSELTLKGMTVLINDYPGDLLDYLYNNHSEKAVDNFSRYYFILFDHVKDIHNFSLIVERGKFYGAIDKKGNFNGLVGSMQRKEIDVGLTPIYYKTDRLPFVDFLVPTYLMKTRFIFRHPKPGLTIRGAFFSPLSSVVWLSTWGVMILTAFIVRVVFQHEWKLERERNDATYTEYDWSYILLLIFGGVCQQDVPRIPNLYSGRTVVFTSILFTYLLYQFYSGGIVSSLLSDPPIMIKDLKDLLDSNLKVGVEDIVYEHDYFDQTNDPVAIKLFERKIVGKKNGSEDAFYDLNTGMDLVRKGGFAFQTDTSTAYNIIRQTFSNKIICELGEVQLYPTQYTAGILPKRIPFKEILLNRYFQTNDPIAIELFKRKIAGKRNGTEDAFYDVKSGMELVQKGGFAFQIDTSTGYGQAIEQEYSNEIICELGEVQLYANQYMTGVVQQFSQFRELFVYSFQRMVEVGLLHRQRLRWTIFKPACIKIVDSSTIFVGIKEFFPAILFYIVGILITFIIFGFEIWIKRKKDKKMIKKLPQKKKIVSRKI